MKILLVHNYYQSKFVSGEDVVFDNEVLLLQERLGRDNVLVYKVFNDDINKIRLFFNIWHSFEHGKAISNIVTNNNIDLVHVHNFFPVLTPSVFKAAKHAGAIVIHTLHNYRFWCISGSFYKENSACEICANKIFPLHGILNKCYRKSLVQSLFTQVVFLFYKLTKYTNSIDYFFVLTNFQKNKVIDLGVDKNKIFLKPNSVQSFDRPIEYKNKNGYIFVGRLEESKGIIELLKIWKGLENKFVLTIVGSGELEVRLKNDYQQNNIIFKGKCSRKETMKYIAKSCYLVQPSLLYETFGLTIIEAMGEGVPVIGLNVGTRVDFIKNGENGFLTNLIDLSEIIKRSYQYKKYDYLCKNAVKTSLDYKGDTIISKQLLIYESIISK